MPAEARRERDLTGTYPEALALAAGLDWLEPHGTHATFRHNDGDKRT